MYGWLVTHSLSSDSFLELSGGRVDANIAGDIYHVIGLDGLGEGRQRCWGLVREHHGRATKGALRAHVGWRRVGMY